MTVPNPQSALPFFESDKAATKYAVQASGKTVKDVAHAIWPNKSIERAQTDLLNALNENRETQLSTDEHMAVARYCGQYDWLYYVCHRCSHSRPVPVTPADQAAELQAALFSKADELRAVLSQIEALKPRLSGVSRAA